MKNLNDMTIVELTALYNASVSSDKQIKKFRTKEQGIAHITDVLQLVSPNEVVVSTEPVTLLDIVKEQEKNERRKPVKGVVKLCRSLLVNPTDQALDETIINAIAQKYITEGGYDEKTAKSSAQTILADTKKRMAVPVAA
jgi:hypothetical protein